MILLDYETLVKRMARENSNDLIDNDTIKHAKILVAELVKSSTEKVRLYTNSFCEEFYDDKKIQRAFKEASDRGISLDVLSENDLRGNKAFQDYETFFGDKLKYKNINVGVYARFDEATPIRLNNFMVIDDCGIRYEQEDTANACEEIENVKARATFNRKDDVEPFVSAFEERFCSCR